MNEKLLELLRLWNDGKTQVLVCRKKSKDYIYCIAANDESRNALEVVFESVSVENIIDRIQFELYGEFPLSPMNQFDFENNISRLFKN